MKRQFDSIALAALYTDNEALVAGSPELERDYRGLLEVFFLHTQHAPHDQFQRFLKDEFPTLSEFSVNADIEMNCAEIGAQITCEDHRLDRIRVLARQYIAPPVLDVD
ncbi:MAG: hypothetical protein ACK4VI_08015 [Alphaproteobacteria bacterium]